MTELRFPDLRRLAQRLAVALLLVVLLLAAGSGWAAGNFPSAYVVAGVPVDATAENAVAARDAARAQGQKIAFRRLLERLAPKSEWGKLPNPGDAEIAALVQDFEVANEHASGVRYLGSYTFRFSPNGVRHMLRNAGISITELASKPIVLVPLLKTGQTVTLWGDPNPWRDAWKTTPGNGGLVPFVVPPGDLADVQTFDAPVAADPKPEQLHALSAHYGNGDVVVVTATATSGTEAALSITVSRYSPDGTPDASTTSVSGPRLDASLYQSGVQAAMRELEESWKKVTVASAGDQDSMIEVVVPIKSAAEWAAVRERLSKVSVIRGTDLELMGHAEVRLRLKIKADPNLLKVALTQQDLVLTPGTPYGVLQLHAHAAGE
jgi:hypothetical protein